MTDIGDRLASILRDAVPAPQRELDPSAIRAGSLPRRRRRRVLAPVLAAAAVAAVTIGVPLARNHLAAQQQPAPGRAALPTEAAVPSPPAGFSASEFRMAAPPQMVIGPVTMPRATCTPQQISATAATRRTDGGVLGVIHLIGVVVSHRYGLAERCTLPIARGPSALIGLGSRRLRVPLSRGDPTSPPANPRPDIALNNGDAVWGFAWLGSYCGLPARAIEVPLDRAGDTPLRVPLRGPQPDCEPTSGTSTLIDGVAGAPGEPVQPPRPDYSRLRLAGQIEPGTTHAQLAPIDLTLRAIGSAPVALDPCPTYAGRDDATARSGGFSDPISSGHLACTKRETVIRPGHPLHWTIPATSLLQTPGTGAKRGSTVYVELGIAGVPLLHLKAIVHR
jgi:hypothetical protein